MGLENQYREDPGLNQQYDQQDQFQQQQIQEQPFQEEGSQQQQIDPFEEDLANLLFTIIQLEQQIEDLRCGISENDKFCTWEAFQHIDQGGHGLISANDLKIFFSNNHIAVHEHECDFLIYEYSTCDKNEKRLQYSDLLKIILPRQDLKIRDTVLQRRRKYTQMGGQPELPFYLEEQLAQLLEQELNYLRQIEGLKIDILNKYTQNFREAFYLITKGETDYIDAQIMYQFLKSKNQDYEIEYYKYLQERLDRDKSRTLTIDEFCNAIFPSDFIQRPPQPQKQTKSFNQLIKGDEIQFLNYIQKDSFSYPQKSQPKKQLKQQQQFDPDQYKFQNSLNFVKYVSQNPQNSGTIRKFLKTNMQFEKSFNISPQQLNFRQQFKEDTNEENGGNENDTDEQQIQSPYKQSGYIQQQQQKNLGFLAQNPSYYQRSNNTQPQYQEGYQNNGGLDTANSANTGYFNNNFNNHNQQPQQQQYFANQQRIQDSQTSSIEDNRVFLQQHQNNYAPLSRIPENYSSQYQSP